MISAIPKLDFHSLILKCGVINLMPKPGGLQLSLFGQLLNKVIAAGKSKGYFFYFAARFIKMIRG